MKRLFVILLAIVMVASLAACTGTSADPTEAEQQPEKEAIVGGWSIADSPAVSDEVKELVNKAAEKLDGAVYTPVAYVASQVVAGTNHLVLCTIDPLVPDSKATYALVTVYEDLQGNAEITNVYNSEAESLGNYQDPEATGTWKLTDPPVVTEDAKNALEKAVSSMTGTDYTPLALLGTQLVSGTNYCLLCELTPVTANPEPYYAIVTVYEDLQGNAEITDTYDFSTEE
ncbi:MAG: hypothetical protein IJH40_08540 [Ruminococcus sp.]|uniref:hypothetical protein n=1 Tax=Ruminococcus sp. TaxID=41978 RepID=UPI00287361D9|nr:hypothetical protein [Ruminococcus sp.]MBQ3285673.1 hypothetical protein [Ruminococcus sp.]